jgi:hypothetical protein
MVTLRRLLPALVAAVLLAGSATADREGLKKGTPDIKSAGPLAFGPEGILFIGDPRGAAIFAIDTGDRTASTETGRPKVEGIDAKIASKLGVEARDLQVNGLAVNPISGNTYLSVGRGRGPDATPVLVRVSRAGTIAEVPLKDVPFSKVAVPNPTEGRGRFSSRADAITHLAYLKGRVLMAGLSNEEFASKLRAFPFPFKESDKGTSIEIFHGAHGRLETNSPVRTFAPYQIKGEDHLLAAYTCTPLVKIPIKDLKPGAKVRGTTVAELGNRNRPLQIIVYRKDGKDYALMCNSSRGLMKIQLEGVGSVKPITNPVRGGTGKAGLPYETIAKYKNAVQKLDAFDRDHAVLLVGSPGGMLLETIELP